MNTNAKSDTVFKFIHHRQTWYQYRDGVYTALTEDDMNAVVMGYLRNRHPEHATKNMHANVIANLKASNVAHIPSHVQLPARMISTGQYEQAPGLVVMQNCVLDYDKTAKAIFMGEHIPKTDYVFPHSPKIISTAKLDYPFDPSADCPSFKKYLSEVLVDPDKIEQMQMLFGISFVAITRYNIIIIFYGDGGTGKTVSIHVLDNSVGTKNTCCVPLRFFSNRFALHPLTTSLLNIVGEMDTETENSGSLGTIEGTLKDVSSGGEIRVEQKNKEAYKAPATARCVFATNSLPAFVDRSDGIWDRLRIIPFEIKIRDTEKDNKFLKEQIVATELPGVFMWGMKGYAKLLKLGHFPECSRGREIKNKYRLNCDHERMFLQSTYEFTGDAVDLVETERAYKDYRLWMANSGYRGIRHISNFNDAVEREFKHIQKTRKVLADVRKTSCWVGLKIKKES